MLVLLSTKTPLCDGRNPNSNVFMISTIFLKAPGFFLSFINENLVITWTQLSCVTSFVLTLFLFVTGSTGRVRRIFKCRACAAEQVAAGLAPAPCAALLAPSPQRRPALAASSGPLTPARHYVSLFMFYEHLVLVYVDLYLTADIR